MWQRQTGIPYFGNQIFHHIHAHLFQGHIGRNESGVGIDLAFQPVEAEERNIAPGNTSGLFAGEKHPVQHTDERQEQSVRPRLPDEFSDVDFRGKSSEIMQMMLGLDFFDEMAAGGLYYGKIRIGC